MANEFITRNGLISLSNATVTGSLNVSGSTTLVGPVTSSNGLAVNGGNITAGAIVKNGGTAAQFLKADGSVDNTVYAPLASPALTGTPTSPTAAPGTNTTQLATTAFVQSALPTGGPFLPLTGGTMTGQARFNNYIDAFFGTTATGIGIYFDGSNLNMYNGVGGANIMSINQATNAVTIFGNTTIYGSLISPSLTGTPTAPTAAPGTNTTQLATTAFVQAAIPSTASQTVVNGSISGNIKASQPFQGSSYKMVLIYMSALNGTATYTYPTAFTGGSQPAVTYVGGGGAAATNTSVTITGTTTSGFIKIEGY